MADDFRFVRVRQRSPDNGVPMRRNNSVAAASAL
jgi:hypothetical protein